MTYIKIKMLQENVSDINRLVHFNTKANNSILVLLREQTNSAPTSS